MDGDDIDFAFMKDIGFRVNAIFCQDPNMQEWMQAIINEYNEKYEYPENLVNEIINYLSDLKGRDENNLIDDIKKVVNDKTNVDNLLGYIFFPSTGEEEEEEAPDNTYPTIDDDLPTEIDEASLSPEQYFENCVKKASELCFVSNDIAYALLSKFLWDKNQLEANWFSNRDEILKSLRIKEGSDLVPDLHSPLSMKKSKEGECPICLEEEDLYQLYCGHIICKNCLIKDIIEQVRENRPPRCRDCMPDKSLCNAEIMDHDVKELLDDENYKKYCKVVLNNNIARDHQIKCCQNPFCDWIITPANRLPCHVGRCYRCNYVTCLKCDNESHAPLINCEFIENFTVEVAEEMEQLEQDQKSWFAREERLQDYRRSHISEVRSVLDKGIQQLREKQYLESKQEQKRIDDIGKEVNDYQSQISALRRKLNEYLDKRMPKDDVNHIMAQIQDLTEIYNQKSELRNLYIKDKKRNDEDRSKYLNTAEQENGYFISALSGGQYQFYMTKFKESQEFRAYQNISVTSNDDDYIKRITKKCPKCHSPIQRTDGCNYMACNICNFEFCWACEKPWHPTHGDHFKCPNIKTTTTNAKKSRCGINFNDMSDYKFYPQPMSIDKRAEFIRYHNLNNKFREEKSKYKALYEEFMNTENKDDISKGLDKVPDFKLCTRNRLIKVLKGSYNESDSEINAMRVMNTVLFAQSVIMWSYPSLYYMVRDPHKAQVFEYKITSLEKRKNNMIRYINEATSFTGTDIMTMKETLRKEIENIIDDADIF